MLTARNFPALLFVTGAAAMLAGPAAFGLEATAPSSTSSQIQIDNFTFSPPVLTVAVGTSVTWVNGDDIPHTVAAKDRSFRSKPLDTEDRFSFVFLSPGSYDYFCSLHPHMVGKVVVVPKA
jgi:plastocyanin